MPTYTPRKKIAKPSGSESFTRTAITGALDQIDEYNEWLADNYSHDLVISRTDDVVTKIEEKLPTASGVMRTETVLTRASGILTSIRSKVFGTDGVTVKKDVIYSLIRLGDRVIRVEVRPQ